MKRYCISDIHGCLEQFRELLDVIKFCKSDKLYILGDMIDRGPDSAGVVQYILDLKSKGYKIKAILGNHELMMLESREIHHNFTYSSSYDSQTLWAQNGGVKFLESYNVEPKDYDIFWSCLPQDHKSFFESLKYDIVLKDFILVHAGLKFSSNRDDRMMELMYGVKPLPPITNPLKQTIDYDKVWIRDFKVDPELMGEKILITGHTPLPLFDSIWPIRDESNKTKHIMIDGGCWYKQHKDQGYGYLVALRLEDKELFWVENK